MDRAHSNGLSNQDTHTQNNSPVLRVLRKATRWKGPARISACLNGDRRALSNDYIILLSNIILQLFFAVKFILLYCFFVKFKEHHLFLIFFRQLRQSFFRDSRIKWTHFVTPLPTGLSPICPLMGLLERVGMRKVSSGDDMAAMGMLRTRGHVGFPKHGGGQNHSKLVICWRKNDGLRVPQLSESDGPTTPTTVRICMKL
jgi:hypothetical protein